MFGNPLPEQNIIKIDTVKEITDRSSETIWNDKRDFTILGLPTKRNIHFFFQVRDIYYRAVILRSEMESYSWDRFEGRVVRLGGEDLEKIKWEIYDEIIDDLDIK
jgi:hypothetical protein